MSAADEQAREVEVVRAVLANRPSMTYGVSNVILEHIAGDVLAALEPIRAAERQEAARKAAERAWVEGYTRGWFSAGGGEGLFDPTVEPNPYRADGVTGRSET